MCALVDAGPASWGPFFGADVGTAIAPEFVPFSTGIGAVVGAVVAPLIDYFSPTFIHTAAGCR